MKCIYNRRALKHFSCIMCYFCLSSFNEEDLLDDGKEELECPMCAHKSIIAVTNDDKLTKNWVGLLSSHFFDFSKREE